MPGLFLVHFDSLGKSVVVSPGTTLFEAARRAGLDMPAACNGQAWCGECCVDILEGEVSPLTHEEVDVMSAEDRQQNHRLACCARVYSPVKVRLVKR